MIHHASRFTFQQSRQASNTVVQFYIAATDGLGAQILLPPEGPRSRALYTVNDGRPIPRRTQLSDILAPDAAFFYAPTI